MHLRVILFFEEKYSLFLLVGGSSSNSLALQKGVGGVKGSLFSFQRRRVFQEKEGEKQKWQREKKKSKRGHHRPTGPMLTGPKRRRGRRRSGVFSSPPPFRFDQEGKSDLMACSRTIFAARGLFPPPFPPSQFGDLSIKKRFDFSSSPSQVKKSLFPSLSFSRKEKKVGGCLFPAPPLLAPAFFFSLPPSRK